MDCMVTVLGDATSMRGVINSSKDVIDPATALELLCWVPNCLRLLFVALVIDASDI